MPIREISGLSASIHMSVRKVITSLLFTAAAIAASAQTCLIEAESFQFKGKWVVEKSSECLGTAMLRVFAGADTSDSDDALTAVNIAQEGTYHVWTRSRDYAASPYPRTYTLSVDEVAMTPSGSHGTEGFIWEHVGSVNLQAKNTLLRLHDTGAYYGRCDAILLTTDASVNPNSLTNTQLARWRKTPVALDYDSGQLPSLSPDLDIEAGYTTLATVKNGEIRVSFVRLADGTIVCKNDFYAAGSWRRYRSSAEDNRVAIISNQSDIAVNFNNFYPAWDYCAASRTVNFGGVTYPVTVDGDRTNPYFTGSLTEARATAVTKTDASTIKVTYDAGGLGTLIGYWSVPETGAFVNVRMRFTPGESGSWSVALHGAKGVPGDDVTQVMMPPMFQQLRIPATPQMMTASMMTQCVAMVESEMAFGAASAFVAADLDAFNSDWGTFGYSPVGFILRNSLGDVQPVAVSPVPGMRDARVSAGRTLEVRFVAGIIPSGISDALPYVSDNVFEVADYRNPGAHSLSDAYHNVVSLLCNNGYNGWNPDMKGFWDIECNGNTNPTVVQSSPLSVVAASMAAADEDMYVGYALPTIEYMLSRNAFRTPGKNAVRLDPMRSQFPTTCYEGLNTLMAGINPWLSALALPGGELRSANGYFSSVEPYRQALSAYRLTGDESWLGKAQALAASRLDALARGDDAVPAPGTFYNSQMCADWQSLLDMYAATADEQYLSAASVLATATLAGVKTWPRVAGGDMTVHPGGVYDGVTTIWWKGSERFRLGFPRTEGDAPEHQVNAAQVSSVGLGIEQPATYFLRTAGKNIQPVMMSNWAPALLRLAAATGKPVYETYARNAVIGRAANYPGYYATGYTDITASPDFPYTGPDVSSIYYHHIPAYMGMLQDYLLTEAATRSDGAISFPSARQEGFVWFANNVCGMAPGSVYGSAARLWMPAEVASIDNAAVNLVTARGDNRLYLILTNDTDCAAAAGIALSSEIAAQVADGEAIVYAADGSESAASFSSGNGRAEVPSRGILTISIPMQWSDGASAAVSPLGDGMKVVDTATSAGKIYLYRIRSPFGWDSIYGCAEGNSEGLRIEVTCNEDHASATAWPYEWSFARYGYDEPVKVTVTVNGSQVADTTFVPGSSGVDDVVVTDTPVRPQGIYRLDGVRVSAAIAPGFYVINGRKTLIR